MTQIIWSSQAIEDVEAIHAYVARDSLRYADLLVERLVSAVEGLETDPLSGRIVPEVGDETVREVIHGNDRIAYRVRPDLVRDCDRLPWCPSISTAVRSYLPSVELQASAGRLRRPLSLRVRRLESSGRSEVR